MNPTKLITCISCIFCFTGTISAVQLENWRLPYYTAASRMGYFSSSPSGMFWDNFGQLDSGKLLFDKRLWPDSAKNAANHWILEPAVSWTTNNDTQYFGKSSAFHLSALNDIRYNNFLLRQVLDVDSRYFDDPGFPWMKQRVAAGRIAEAYLQYDFKYGFARYGRLNRNWGPFIDRSLFLSNNAYSFDALEFGLHSSLFEFRHLFAALPRTALSLDADVSGTDRYLTAHSLNFLLGRFGSVGITETVLFARDRGFPDFQYINPVAIYSVINTNAEGNANLMLGFQWDIHPGIENATLKGQIILDDFQIDNEVPGDQEPTHWGGDFGGFIHDFLPLPLHHLLALEYRVCSSWLYTVADEGTDNGERYTYLGKSLGVPDNDYDSLNLSFSCIGKNYWSASAGLFYKRKGENRVSTRWNGLLGYRDENPFPRQKSAPVEFSTGLSLNATGYFQNYAGVTVGLCNRWIENRDNIKYAFVYSPIFSLSLNVQYANLFFALPK